MLSKPAEDQFKEPEAKDLDEGWWASVLSDEETLTAPAKLANSKAVSPAMGRVDWDQVKALYDRDEVVDLIVHGYNRGGLLVQATGIQGFVPISHLVDMPSNATEEDRRQMLAGYIGRSLCLKVIECEPSQERIVLSGRAALAPARTGRHGPAG